MKPFFNVKTLAEVHDLAADVAPLDAETVSFAEALGRTLGSDLCAPHDLPGNDTAIIYRVFAEGAPVAALFAVTARDGYAGPIRILVGVGIDGTVTGVRIVEHRETPGLGDRIDQSRSDWVYQFDGRSLLNPAEADWLLEVDGGEFDQLTGASVTPRAVIKAIRDTLIYFDAHRDEIFTMPASEEQQ